VEFPLVLDLTGYAWNPEATVYDLQGVIVHDGALVTEGHYYAFVQERGQWWEYNDEKVIRVSAMYSWSCHASWKCCWSTFGTLDALMLHGILYQAVPMALAFLLTQTVCTLMGTIQLAHKPDAWHLFAITMRAQAHCFQNSVSWYFPCHKSCQLSHDQLPV